MSFFKNLNTISVNYIGEYYILITQDKIILYLSDVRIQISFVNNFNIQ